MARLTEKMAIACTRASDLSIIRKLIVGELEIGINFAQLSFVCSVLNC